jgi:adenylate cyclase class 1
VQFVHNYQKSYNDLNIKRLELAREVMSHGARYMFDFVPSLLHYNHPLIPCFVDGDVPHGIYNFQSNIQLDKYVRNLDHYTGSIDDLKPIDNSILALFCMGSTSSIGQGVRSDIDYWVCVSHHMKPESISLLEVKCNKITQMGRKRGVDINFFIVKDNKFKEVNNDITNNDSCGSAQHMFLLDEFYRSAIHIAGKKLLWMIVPLEYESNYESFVNDLHKNSKINLDDWIDFGNIGQIPINEYYGSALWLMCKGIDSPFKAVLKILLMEAYSAEYPNTILLSLKIKEKMHSIDSYNLELDSYYMVYKKVSDYLTRIKDFERLNLLRICFYQKIIDGLNDIDNLEVINKRKLIIDNLIDEWGFDNDKISFIKNISKWSIADVKRIYNMLLTAMMQSYKSLLNFGIKNKIVDAVRPVDISILSRKLYAAFDNAPGKVKIYNLNIGPNIEESHVSLIEIKNSNLFRDGWYLYNSSLKPKDIIGKKPLTYHPDLPTMLVSCYFNGIISISTDVEIYSKYSDIPSKRIYKFIRDLYDLFNSFQYSVTNEDLLRPAKVVNLGIFLNFSKDTTHSSNYRYINNDDINVFTYPPKMTTLVESILVVFKNSWNETYCYNYEGNLAFFNFLHELNHYFHRGDPEPPQWQIYNYSEYMRPYLSSQVSEVVKLCLEGISSKTKSSFEIKINSEDYVVAFDERFFDITLKIDSTDIDPFFDLYAVRSNEVPPLIESHSTFGYIEYFFVKNQKGLQDIYEVDEYKEIKIYKDFTGAISEFVYSVNSYYSKKLDINNKNVRYKQYFNLPLFFEVDLKAEIITPWLR